MKKLLYLSLFISCLSCKKDNQFNGLKKEIAGTWEIQRYSGYPFTQPIYLSGNGQIIVIGIDGSFERKKHDTLVFKGNYFLKKKKDCYDRETDIIFQTNENEQISYVQIVDGKLALSSSNCLQDGGTAYYTRIE